MEWMTTFHRQTGFTMTDVNLRNFLYDKESKTLYGLDFEECIQSDILPAAACLGVYIRNYFPENTPLKLEISRFVLEQFARNYDLEIDTLLREFEKQEVILLERRKNKRR